MEIKHARHDLIEPHSISDIRILKEIKILQKNFVYPSCCPY